MNRCGFLSAVGGSGFGAPVLAPVPAVALGRPPLVPLSPLVPDSDPEPDPDERDASSRAGWRDDAATQSDGSFSLRPL